jgi:hypothetical protein
VKRRDGGRVRRAGEAKLQVFELWPRHSSS